MLFRLIRRTRPYGRRAAGYSLRSDAQERLVMSLVFPEASTSYAHVSREIRKTDLSIYNRLHSIKDDSAFVERVCECRAFRQLPALANERAGAWYLPPSKRAEGYRAYFKSTDGHAGKHDFSLRRTNLSLLPLLRDHGLIIVDSTRRGKSFPDALSKTIPIWCAVLNAARQRLRPPDASKRLSWEEHGKLWTCDDCVSSSEHGVIAAQVEAWADALLASSYDKSGLTELEKPLRPIFVSPSIDLGQFERQPFTDFLPIVCVSASKQIKAQDDSWRIGGWTYIQGAGDDHESWSLGLDSSTFWDNADVLLSFSAPQLEAEVAELVQHRSDVGVHPPSRPKRVRNTSLHVIKSVPSQGASQVEVKLSLIDKNAEPDLPSYTVISRTGKTGKHQAIKAIDPAVDWLHEAVVERGLPVAISVESGGSDGDDILSALTLIVLAIWYDDDGGLGPVAREVPNSPTKALVRERLVWLLEAEPALNPSRAILQLVNAYLKSRSSHPTKE